MHDMVWNSFAFYGGVVVAKTILMSPITAFQRIRTKTFANAEDAAGFSTTPQTHDAVERVRRAHQNDLENIIPFFCLGLLYCHTDPSLEMAKWHFRIFAASRIWHTIAYLSSSSARGPLGFLPGLIVNISMAYQVIIHFKDAL